MLIKNKACLTHFCRRHIQKVLTDVNAATGELFTSEVLARQGEEADKSTINGKDDKGNLENGGEMNGKEETGKDNVEEGMKENVMGKEKGDEISFDVTSVFDQVDDSKLYFSPDQGNVVFSR